MAFNKLVYIQLHLYDRWQINTIQYNTIHLSLDRSLWQFRKKWTFCLDYPGFSSGIELRLAAAATDSILRITRVSAVGYKLQLSQVRPAGYELRLIFSWCWLQFQRLDTSYSWLHPTDDLSSGGWIRVTDDYILWLTLLPIAGYNLRLIPSCGWLWVAADSSFGCLIRVTGDSILRLTTSCGWFYQVNLRIYSAKYIILMVCFLRPDFS